MAGTDRLVVGILGAIAVAVVARAIVKPWKSSEVTEVESSKVSVHVGSEAPSPKPSHLGRKVAKMRKTLAIEKKKLIELRKQSERLRGHRSAGNQRALDKRVAKQEEKVEKLEVELLTFESKMR